LLLLLNNQLNDFIRHHILRKTKNNSSKIVFLPYRMLKQMTTNQF